MWKLDRLSELGWSFLTLEHRSPGVWKLLGRANFGHFDLPIVLTIHIDSVLKILLILVPHRSVQIFGSWLLPNISAPQIEVIINGCNIVLMSMKVHYTLNTQFLNFELRIFDIETGITQFQISCSYTLQCIKKNKPK